MAFRINWKLEMLIRNMIKNVFKTSLNAETLETEKFQPSNYFEIQILKKSEVQFFVNWLLLKGFCFLNCMVMTHFEEGLHKMVFYY